MKRYFNNKGDVLLQAVVFSMILAMMGAMTLKWTIARRTTVVHTRDAVDTRALLDACRAQLEVKWFMKNVAPTSDSCQITGPYGGAVTVKATVSGSQVTYTLDTRDLK